MEKLKMHTPDMTSANIARIRELFPGCVTESRDDNGQVKLAVDFDQLRQELSDSIVEGPQERYHLNWPGKREALLTANAPIAKTLRPAREESVNFDTTQNLFIEGDNLEALKLLQETYLGKVKMIYIDPPYNTGNDFIYDDDFVESCDEFLIRSNQKDETGNRLVANPESNGRFHSDWLSMVYPRIKLARNLLRDDGVIFISIDGIEADNLKKVCDEVFGEDNHVETVVVARSANGMGSKEGYATNHDYVLVYKKSSSKNPFKGMKPDNNYIRKFDKSDSFGKYKIDGIFRKKGKGARREDSPNCFYPIFYNPETGAVLLEKQDGLKEARPLLPNGKDGRWVWSKDFAKDKLHRLYASKGGTIYVKDYWQDDIRQKPRSIFSDNSYLTDKATNEIIDMFGEKIFSTPKPVNLIYDLIDNCLSSGDTIVDFFSGSATTAHSLLKHCAENGRNANFVLVQLPEELSPNNDEQKAAYDFCIKNGLLPNICSLAKERIRRAGKKILEGECHENWNKDVGFRVMKIDSSNMAEVYYTPDGVKQVDLLAAVDNIKPDRKPEDLLFQVLLDWGVDLSLPITRQTIQGKTVFFVDGNALAACFDNGITEDLVKELASGNPLRVVFRDNGFVSDSVKINAGQIFRQMSPGTDVKSI